MLREFVDRILELKQEPIIKMEGVSYLADTGKVLTPLSPASLKFLTLTGFLDYIRAGKELDCQRAFFAIHILSPVCVDVISQADALYRHREVAAQAVLNLASPTFGNWMDQEAFSVFLQTEFVATEARAALLRGVGLLEAEDVRTSKDDGVTQTVSARKGIVLRERKEVPSPVTLAPFRTFREVAQPESIFVLRIRESTGGVQLALFPSDGNSWVLEAIGNIKEWLKANLGDLDIPVLG